MAYLPELHRCCSCGVDLGPENGDGICSECEEKIVDCPICSYWASETEFVGHHARCPLNPDLAPSEDGSCHCGATVISTADEGCLFCGGFTQDQMDRIRHSED